MANYADTDAGWTKWAEEAEMGVFSPDESMVKVRDAESSDIREVEVQEAQGGHPCIFDPFSEKWLYLDPASLADEFPFKRYDKIAAAHLSFSRHGNDPLA